MRSSVTIRSAKSGDADRVWAMFRHVVATGDSYAFPPDTDRDTALAYWLAADKRTYVALVNGAVAGTYILRDNQPGLGAHVANASFMVAADTRGLGIGRVMGEHALAEAKRLGYRAMQFNLVVSTNFAAVSLWKKLGFTVIGTIPDAFDHRGLGRLVDAHIMYRPL